MLTRSAVRNQIRGFVLIWTGITLVMAMATFFAIYLTYGGGAGPVGDTLTENIALPTTAAPILVVPSNTPTLVATTPAATATGTPDAGAQVALDASSTPSPTIEPTLLPVDNTAFDVGIQVQHALDFNVEIQDGWIRLLDQLNMSWMKFQVRWEEIEQEQGQYDWSVLDLVLDSTARFNKKVMLSIVTAPEWAREPGVNLDRHGPPADSQDYANFVTEILKRYPGKVHAIEVWNEQNLDREWTSTRGLVAANYVELLRTTYQAVKDVDPGVIVISGALSPTGLNDGVGAWDDFIYLDQLIQAGMLNYADCIGAHHNGYNIGPDVAWDNVPNDPTATFRGPFDNPHHSWSFRSTLQTYANKVRLAGGTQKLCVTEFGWPVTEDLSGTPLSFEFAADNTLEEQKQFFVEALAKMEEWDIVWLAFIWNLNYGPQAGWDATNDNVPYSLIGPEFVFRPAYDAVKEWLAEYRQRTDQE